MNEGLMGFFAIHNYLCPILLHAYQASNEAG